MNVYDAARPGQAPRLRYARPGGSLDDVYASRYRHVGTAQVEDGVIVDIDLTGGETGDGPTPVNLEKVQQVVDDETPPDARPRTQE